MNGILPLWKPKGMTSFDCVAKCRRYFNTKKVGHTGTLDPEVEGVLPICIGNATKIVPFLTDTKKIYLGTVALGTTTETEDATGKVIEEKEVVSMPTKTEIENALQKFQGAIQQIPPMYSAVKVNGKKLYEYARANEEVERPVREVFIHDIQLLAIDDKKNTFDLYVECSKGTYIRTLCVDIGKVLGYPAHMHQLERIKTGSFSKKNTVTFAMIEEAAAENKQEQLLSPISEGLGHLLHKEVNEALKVRIKNGQKLAISDAPKTDEPFVFTNNQEVLAIYGRHPEKPDQIKPLRVF
ncbi:tRNA pseudouridine(55) synthase TruB [Oceanobacillus sp. J11TS1]|uniref:tRNA pseudouridine(55) synthase TruB n=1 Tax=Oceanobacillus sp. J11TS1 TaxID=2807191 RepID=UPI001B251AA3|nr:tRNA pseudouridine(55) synthase TruB [Oceanobacillus sp. J11TS1]GIO22008.1 tRNA pseudouridine synthase B [Oceanobacillus sp. J11TS1]